jgi:polyphosphate kinase 2 (PPK2 family)
MGDYTIAVNDMVARTSTRIAPWTLIEGNDKNFAREGTQNAGRSTRLEL